MKNKQKLLGFETAAHMKTEQNKSTRIRRIWSICSLGLLLYAGYACSSHLVHHSKPIVFNTGRVLYSDPELVWESASTEFYM